LSFTPPKAAAQRLESLTVAKPDSLGGHELPEDDCTVSGRSALAPGSLSGFVPRIVANSWSPRFGHGRGDAARWLLGTGRGLELKALGD
jgi:hypothetical protein